MHPVASKSQAIVSAPRIAIVHGEHTAETSRGTVRFPAERSPRKIGSEDGLRISLDFRNTRNYHPSASFPRRPFLFVPRGSKGPGAGLYVYGTNERGLRASPWTESLRTRTTPSGARIRALDYAGPRALACAKTRSCVLHISRERSPIGARRPLGRTQTADLLAARTRESTPPRLHESRMEKVVEKGCGRRLGGMGMERGSPCF